MKQTIEQAFDKIKYRITDLLIVPPDAKFTVPEWEKLIELKEREYQELLNLRKRSESELTNNQKNG